MPRRSDKRERLLDAAAQVFWTSGYASTSLADIAEVSGVPLGNIYYYFKTKAALAEGVSEIFVSETHYSLKKIDEENDDISEKLKTFMNLLRDSAMSRSKLGCPLASAVRDFSAAVPTAAERTNEVFDILIGWLAQTLSKTGDRYALRHARSAIARWQGAIVLAHGAKSETILIEALNDLELDILRWAQSEKASG